MARCLLAALGSVALLYGAAAAAQCPQASFRGVAEWSVGQTPRLVQFANIDGDEWPDLLVASREYNSQPLGGLVVLAGDGGQSWDVRQELVPTHNVDALAVADFDDDGDDDAAYFQARTSDDADSGHHIRILMNDRGTLAEKTVIVLPPVSGGASTLLLPGDFNGDGQTDLFYAADDGTSVSLPTLYLGRGDGTFTETSVPAPGVIAASAEDLDRDGDDDVVVSFVHRSSRWLGWFSFDAQGAATLRQIYAPGRRPTVVAVADTNGDGAFEILSSDGSQNFDVHFSAATPGGPYRQILSEAHWSTPPVTADFNGDGTADLGLHTFTHGFRYIYGVDPQSSNFTETSPGVWVPRLEGHIYADQGMDTSDVDRDGDVDVALATNYGFTVLENDGTGAFGAPLFATWAFAVGDFNNDGRDDLVDQDARLLQILLAGLGGTFKPADLGITQDPRFDFVEAGDFDNDGKLDLLTFFDSGGPEGTVEIRLGNGDGTFEPPGTPAAVEDDVHIEDRVLADFDGDHNLDLLIVNFADDLKKFVILHGDGHGGFSRVTRQPGGSFISRAAAGDLDGDGDVDLALGSANHDQGRNLLVAYNDGHGTFGTPIEVGLHFSNDIALADLTGDGRLDIITASEYFPIPVYRNDGVGTFTPVGELAPELTSVGELHARDFNRDGRVDLLVLEQGGHTAVEGWLLLYLGRGDGTFGEPARMRTYGSFRDAVGDFNGDGAADLLDGGFVRLNSCGTARRRAVRH
jgi:hypothetical protein